MANDKRAMTAPLALIRVFNPQTKKIETVGKLKSIRVREQIRRGSVTGIGQIYKDEAPAIEWTGSISVGAYLIDFSKCAIPGGINRKTGFNKELWQDTLLLQEQGLQIVILTKTKEPQPTGLPDALYPNGLILAGLKEFATINDAFIEEQDFDITEGAVSGTNLTFSYLTPILYEL